MYITFNTRKEKLGVDESYLLVFRRRSRNSGNMILLSWTVSVMFIEMAFNCNLRASLMTTDFDDPIGRET